MLVLQCSLAVPGEERKGNWRRGNMEGEEAVGVIGLALKEG